MIIDLLKIALTGKTEYGFYFEYSPDKELSTIPNVSVSSPIKITGNATLLEKHCVYLDLDIAFTLKGDCTRCLTATQKEYVINVGERASDDGEDEYKVINDKVDLIPIVENQIIINMPVNFLCKEDCKGICLGCGANLNIGTCKCEK